MNSCPRVRKIASGICAAALACAATGVPAQTAENPELTVLKASPRIANTSSRRVAALVDANEAALRLRKAQLQRKQGAQPLAGEQGSAAGSTAVNYRYWRRQEKLRIVVEQAQRRSNEMLRPQIAAR